MIRGLARLSATHPVSVLSLWAIILAFGVVSLAHLPLDVMPTDTVPRLDVITEQPGLSAEEVEKLITVPLEEALSSVSDVRRIDSLSRKEVSQIRLSLKWGTDEAIVALEAREHIDRAYRALPHGTEKPVVVSRRLRAGESGSWETDGSPEVSAEVSAGVLLAAIPGPGLTVADISDVVAGELVARLRQVDGVSSVSLRGTRTWEIQIEADPAILQIAGLSLEALAQVLHASVFELPAGSRIVGTRNESLRVSTGVDSLEALRKLPLSGQAAVLRVEDVAEVSRRQADAPSFFLVNGEAAVGLLVSPGPRAGVLRVSNAVRRSLPEIRRRLQGDMDIVIVHDGAKDVRRAVSGLVVAAALGAVAVAAMVSLCFRRVATAVAVLSALVVCLSATFLVLFSLDLPVNLVTLTAMAVGTVIVVENNLAVLGNIAYRTAREPLSIADAVTEVGASTWVGTAAVILALAPVLFTQEVLGLLLRDAATAMAALAIVSFPVSLTVPSAVSALSPWAQEHRRLDVHTRFPSMLRPVGRATEKLLCRPRQSLGIYGTVVAVTALLFVASDRHVVPHRRASFWNFAAELPWEMPMDGAVAFAKAVDRELQSTESIETRVLFSGFDGNRARADEAARASFRRVHGVLVSSASPGTTAGELSPERFGVSGTIRRPRDQLSAALGSYDDLRVVIQGTTRQEAIHRARAFVDRLKSRGVVNPQTGPIVAVVEESGAVQVGHRFIVDRDAAAHWGMASTALLSGVATATEGIVVARLPSDPAETDVRVRVAREYLQTIEQIQRLPVWTGDTAMEVGGFGRFEETTITQDLRRIDRQPVLPLRFVPATGCLSHARAALESNLPAGAAFPSPNALREQGKDFVLAVTVALLLFYLILSAHLKSFGAPIPVIGSFPTTLCGALGLLLILGRSINVASALGIPMLFATSTNAAVLLIDGFRRTGGRLLEATDRRMPHAILRTTTTVAALAPSTFLPIPGGEFLANSSAAVLGGLVTGTIGMLVLFPVLYRSIAGRR